MRVQELETDEGILEMKVQKNEQGKHNFFIKLSIVDTDSLFELYFSNILLYALCALCINTL